MGDVRDLLDRALDGVEPPEAAYERTIGSARRRDQRKRFLTAVAALTVAAVGVAGLILAFPAREERSDRPRPGREGPPFEQLRRAWSAEIEVDFPIVDTTQLGDIVAIGTDRRVYAFEKACGGTSADCSPSWTAGGKFSFSIAAAQGLVFAGSEDGLLAFPEDCPSNCSPRWTGVVPDGANVGGPIVEGDVIRVRYSFGQMPRHESHSAAFPVDCGSAICSPSWTGALGDGTVYEDGTVAAGAFYQHVGDRLIGYDADCGSGGVECSPSFLWPTNGEDAYVAAGPSDAREIVVSTGDGNVYGFPPACDPLPCSPSWVGETEAFLEGPPLVAGETAVIAGSGSVFGFPAECRSDGGLCDPVWTAKAPERSWVEAADERIVLVDTGSVLNVLPVDCDRNCRPEWSAAPGGDTWVADIIDDAVLVGTTDGNVLAYPVDCQGEDACAPIWSETVTGQVTGIEVDRTGVYVLSTSPSQGVSRQVTVTAFRS
jgi:hypothetical protein